MNIYMLNSAFEPEEVIDIYTSFIWTDRFAKAGDFELYLPMQFSFLRFLTETAYVAIDESEHGMVVESVKLETSSEDGIFIILSGRSYESILDRRIVWGLKTLSGNLQDGIKSLLNECIISPTDSSRRIDNFIFEDSTDPAITSLTIDTQYTGDNLYDVICDICATYRIGFKITLNSQRKLVFKLYSGADRSYDQVSNSVVIFSPAFDNLLESNYAQDLTSFKTCTLVGGEGEGNERKYASYISQNAVGISRREMFTDARDISSTDEDGNTMSAAEYTKLLQTRGAERLSEIEEIAFLDGSLSMNNEFKYGIDFYLGDTVQVENEFGFKASARVTEYIRSSDTSGYTEYPGFELV